MHRVSDYSIYTLVLDHFKLDGGAMFGVVPKIVWEKLLSADTNNRIPLCTRVLVIEGRGRKLVVDLGCGTKWSEKGISNFDIKQQYTGSISDILHGVTDVVLSHLHFDHCGGVSRFEGTELKLNFPSANHCVSESNFLIAQKPHQREKASYLAENISILQESPLRLLKDNEEIAPDVRVALVHGHTQGMLMVSVYEKDIPRIVFVSDLIPTRHHIQLPYIMGYDVHASLSLEERLKWYDIWYKNQSILVFPHDRDCAAAVIDKKEERYFLKQQIEMDVAL